METHQISVNKQEFEVNIRKAIELNADKWFMDREKADPEYFKAELGEWKPSRVKHQNYSDFYKGENCSLALLPIEQLWEAPAFLGFGGWNECPAPFEHSSILKYWNSKYGIRSCAFLENTIILLIKNLQKARIIVFH